MTKKNDTMRRMMSELAKSAIRDREEEIAALKRIILDDAPTAKKPPTNGRKKKVRKSRGMSTEARKKISVRMKNYWKTKKGEK